MADSREQALQMLLKAKQTGQSGPGGLPLGGLPSSPGGIPAPPPMAPLFTSAGLPPPRENANPLPPPEQPLNPINSMASESSPTDPLGRILPANIPLSAIQQRLGNSFPIDNMGLNALPAEFDPQSALALILQRSIGRNR